MASRLVEARNARARALGYRNYYDRRVSEGRQRGLSRGKAAGHPGVREVGVRSRTTLADDAAKAIKISAIVVDPTSKRPRIQVTTVDERGKATVRRFDIRARDEIQKILDAQRGKDIAVEGTP